MNFRLIFVSFLAFFPLVVFAEPSSVFNDIVEPANLEAEQKLPAMAPKGSDPIHSTFSKIFKSTGMTGSLPKKYVPAEAQAFEIKTVLLKPEQADFLSEGEIDPSIEAVTFVKVQGKTYLRLFIHPLENANWEKKYPDNPSDPIEWMATPTSSSRSLIIADKDHKFEPFIGKTSLNYTLAGSNRRVSQERGRSAVMVSSMYKDMLKASGGKIPNTNKSWTYFSESLALGAKDNREDYTIMRGMPSDYRNMVYLPFYALISQRDSQENGQGRWVDLLFESSGYTDKLQFIWNEIAKPMLELSALSELDNGLLSELHQQNVMLKVDPKSMRVVGFAIRDLDYTFIDYEARKNLLGLRTPELNQENSRTYGFVRAKDGPMYGYEYMKDSLFKHVFSFFLTPDEVARVVSGGNDFMLKRFNKKYATLIGETRDFHKVKKAFARLYELKTSDEEKKFFVNERRSEKQALPVAYRWGKSIQLQYYLLKQRLEKTGVSPEIVVFDKTAILQQIAEEANGIVPQEALEFWIDRQRFTQSSTQNSMDVELPLSTHDEHVLTSIQARVGTSMSSALDSQIRGILQRGKVSPREMRTIALNYVEKTEAILRTEGKTQKSKNDFFDEIEMTSRLYRATHPYWYTFEGQTPAALIGLTAIPLNVVGLADKVNFADGKKLPPVKYMFHDELHSLGLIDAEEKYLKDRGIVPGSLEHYQEILARVRFTKHFLEWVQSLPDPLDRRIVKLLWFDAFREHLPLQKPTGRGFLRNYYLSPENLQRYVGQYLTSGGPMMKLREKMRQQLSYGQSTFTRFVPGDFLAPTSQDADKFTIEKILECYRKLDVFAKESSTPARLQEFRSRESRTEVRTCKKVFLL